MAFYSRLSSLPTISVLIVNTGDCSSGFCLKVTEKNSSFYLRRDGYCPREQSRDLFACSEVILAYFLRKCSDSVAVFLEEVRQNYASLCTEIVTGLQGFSEITMQLSKHEF